VQSNLFQFELPEDLAFKLCSLATALDCSVQSIVVSLILDLLAEENIESN